MNALQKEILESVKEAEKQNWERIGLTDYHPNAHKLSQVEQRQVEERIMLARSAFDSTLCSGVDGSEADRKPEPPEFSDLMRFR